METATATTATLATGATLLDRCCAGVAGAILFGEGIIFVAVGAKLLRDGVRGYEHKPEAVDPDYSLDSN